VHVQKFVSIVKMATMLEEYTTEEEQSSVVYFVWAKGLNTKDIHKEMFPVYGGKCLSCKAVHKLIEKRGKRFADDEEVETGVRKWLRQLSEDFYAVSFDALVKRWDKCISVGGGYVENFFFQVRLSHVLRFISICDLFTDSLVVNI
jgi:hypothetical protein